MSSNPSAEPFVLELSLEAVDDIQNILQYTYQTWGERQVSSYQAVLDKALSTLQDNPFMGHQRADLGSSYQSLQAGHHIIVYKVAEPHVYVLRILHESMDLGRHLET